LSTKGTSCRERVKLSRTGYKLSTKGLETVRRHEDLEA